MNTITTLIPQYGELNRISKDWIVSHTFSAEFNLQMQQNSD